jgi:MFS family permease
MQAELKSNTTPTAQSAATPAATKRALGLIFFIMLMDIIGLTIIIPVAPFVVGRYSDAALMVTMLTVIYAGAQFVSAPILGKMSDRVGRRPVLLVCVFGSAIGYFMFGIGGALWVLLLSRLIDGATGGNISTAMAYLADTSKPEERAKSFTLVGMAYGFGFIIGPVLGGALGQINLDAPAFAAGVISLISVALIFFALPESLPKEHRETTSLRANDLNPLASIGEMALRPGLGLLLLVYCLFNFAFDGINSTAGVFIVQKFSAQPWQIGLLFVLGGVAMAVVQGALVGKLVPRIGEKRMAMASLIGQAIAAMLIFMAPALWMLYPLTIAQTAVVGFIFPAMAALTTNRVSEREQGKLAGVSAALAALMSAIGPLFAGLVYDHLMPGAPYWIGAIILVLAASMLATLKQAAENKRPVSAPTSV